VVLCLSQDGASTDSFENFRDNSLKGGLLNDISLNPPLLSLVNTFNMRCLVQDPDPDQGQKKPLTETTADPKHCFTKRESSKYKHDI
jgi:hypothetical protein